MTKILKFIEHNIGICIGIALMPFVFIYAYGCQSQTVSLINPTLKVSRAELGAEVDSFLAMAEARFSDLDRQDFIRDTIFNSLSDLIKSSPVSPPGVALIISNLLGFGAVLDNVRKRTLIATLKSRVNNVEKSNNTLPKTS